MINIIKYIGKVNPWLITPNLIMQFINNRWFRCWHSRLSSAKNNLGMYQKTLSELLRPLQKVANSWQPHKALPLPGYVCKPHHPCLTLLPDRNILVRYLPLRYSQRWGLFQLSPPPPYFATFERQKLQPTLRYYPFIPSHPNKPLKLCLSAQ